MIYKMSQTKTNYKEWSKWYDIIYNLISFISRDSLAHKIPPAKDPIDNNNA